MPVDTSIYGQQQAPQFANPFALALQASQLQAQRENTDSLAEQRRGLAQQRQLEIEKRNNALNDQAALDAAVQPGRPLDAILEHLPGHMHAEVTKQWGAADKAAADAREAKAKADTAEGDYFGTLAASVASHGYDPGALALAIAHAKINGHDTAPIEQMITQDPTQTKAIVDGLMAASPTQRGLVEKEKGTQLAADKFAVERPGLVADAAIKQQVAAGTVGGLTPEQQAAGKRADATQQETVRHNRVDEAHATAALTQQAADTPTLTPDALDMVANNFAMTGGGLPPMGMGKAAAEVRSKIINRAAEMYKGLDLTSQKAAYTANQGSLKKLTDTKNAIGAFEKTAQKNIDLFLTQAGKVVDTGSPIANTAARFVSGQMIGSPDQAAFDAARQVAINEIAKVTNGGGLSGVLSDSARHEIAAFNPQNATLKQTVAVVRLLKQDMANRTAGIDEQIDALRKVIATPPGAASAPSTIGRFKVEVH